MMKKVGTVEDEKGNFLGEVWASEEGVILKDKDEVGDHRPASPQTARCVANLLKRAATEVEELIEERTRIRAGHGRG